MFSPKKAFVLFLLACLCLLLIASAGHGEETAPGMLVLKLEKEAISAASGELKPLVQGEIVYRMTPSAKEMTFELSSFSLHSAGLKTREGDNGLFWLFLQPGSAENAYDPKTRTIRSRFLLEPTLSQIKSAYLIFRRGKDQKDGVNGRTNAGTVAGNLTCTLSETPLITGSVRKMRRGSTFSLKVEREEKDAPKAAALTGEYKVMDVTLWPGNEWNRKQKVRAAWTVELQHAILLGTVMTVLASFLLLWLYRRAVVRAMNVPAGVVVAPATQVASPPPTGGTVSPALTMMDTAVKSDVASPDQTAYRQAGRSLREIVGIYVLGGLAYALVIASAYMMSMADGGFNPVRFLWLFSCYAWPTVLAVYLLIPAGRMPVTLGYFATVGAVATIGLVRFPDLTTGQLLFSWFYTNGPGTVLLLAFLNRRVRAVGPLVLAFMLTSVAGAFVIFHVLFLSSDLPLRGVVFIVSMTGLGTTVLLIILIGFAFFGLFGWWLLLRLGRRYQAKKMSDQSISLDALWLLFAVIQGSHLVYKSWIWTLTGVVAFVAYKLVVIGGMRFLTRKQSQEAAGRELLLLRVFSLGHRSQRLFDLLSKIWLRAGSIHLIAGPDLATATVEPHEFLDFVGGRLSRRFVQGEVDLDQRLAQLDTQPDPDGRYRVNEFFCRADTWQMTMQRLADRSDAVLMDLRSFSSNNQGCIYELQQLMNIISLDRLILVIDDSTDQTFLEATLQDLWQYLEPSSLNFGLSKPEIRCFPVRKQTSAEMEQLLMTLFSSQHISK